MHGTDCPFKLVSRIQVTLIDEVLRTDIWIGIHARFHPREVDISALAGTRQRHGIALLAYHRPLQGGDCNAVAHVLLQACTHLERIVQCGLAG